MDPIDMYKLRVNKGIVQPNNPIYTLVKYILTLEKENEQLQSKIIDQQSVDRAPVEDIREPKPRRPYKKRVRKGEEVRRDTGVTEDSTLSES